MSARLAAALPGLLAAVAGSAALAAPAQRCSVLLRAVAPGQALKAEDLQPADCTPPVLQAALRHDSLHHVTRARLPLAVGDVVPAVAPSTLATHAAGDAVVVRARVGQVQVQRAAQVLAPAAAGAPVVVLAGRQAVITAAGADVGRQP